MVQTCRWNSPLYSGYLYINRSRFLLEYTAHKLTIENGRYTGIPRQNMICTVCNTGPIENEQHFLLECTAYKFLREEFFLKLNRQGSRYRSPLSPNAKKKYFWQKKNLFGENKWRKKILLPKNRHHLGCFMSFNRQLTSWITCLKSVADQLIHDDNNSPHCLQLLKRVKLFLFCFLTQPTSVDTC